MSHIAPFVYMWARQHGWTALMYAARKGHESIVAALIAAGAEVNAGNVRRSLAHRMCIDPYFYTHINVASSGPLFCGVCAFMCY